MEQKQVNIRVKKIKDIEFFVNEEVFIENPEEFALRFELKINIKIEDNSVELILSAIYSDKPQGNEFMKIKTSNIFLILELAEFRKPDQNGYDIPDNLLITLLSISISHTRALLAKNSIGTKFADLYIPIVNPSDIFNQLFNKESKDSE